MNKISYVGLVGLTITALAMVGGCEVKKNVDEKVQNEFCYSQAVDAAREEGWKEVKCTRVDIIAGNEGFYVIDGLPPEGQQKSMYEDLVFCDNQCNCSHLKKK